MSAPVTVLTDAIRVAIVAGFRAGNSRQQAAALAGVPRVIWDRWRRAGQREHATWDGSKPLSQAGLLVWELEQADAQLHQEQVARGLLDEPTERARQWYAERRWRVQYGHAVESVLGTSDDERERTTEQMRAKVRAILEAVTGGPADEPDEA